MRLNLKGREVAIAIVYCYPTMGSNVSSMAKISISLPDDLLIYLDGKVENRSALIESLLKKWRQQQEDEVLAQACALVDEMSLGWDTQWQNQVITDWEASG